MFKNWPDRSSSVASSCFLPGVALDLGFYPLYFMSGVSNQFVGSPIFLVIFFFYKIGENELLEFSAITGI